ncbi:d-importin 7/ranbp7 [Anaeramoeba ignava]|uniref:D-importin 7/ranbp7 n=1 Tax=Anaeramoeba ignava TaxID=1746090 RepID=A0A9Q0L9G4_ANAIG|nr:d-importin 7/ranbp7 [Anaeramoeba ignava]
MESEEELKRIFAGTLSIQQSEREFAQNALDKLQKTKGFLSMLMKFSLNSSNKLSHRQAASIYLKRSIINDWEIKEETQEAVFSEEDKQFIIENIIEAMTVAHPLIRSQIAQCFLHIIIADYPERTPNLLENIIELLNSGNVDNIYGALLALRYISSRYELKPYEKRLPLFEIIDKTFGILLSFFQQLIQMNTNEAGILIKLICKIFWSASMLVMPNYLMNQEVFEKWLELFIQILTRDITEDEQPNDVEERIHYIWWKCKKWVLHIFNRLFQRFGDTKIVQDRYKDFSSVFMSKYISPMLRVCVSIIDKWENNQLIPDVISKLILSFLNNAMFYAVTFKEIQQFLPKLILNIIYPIICFSKTDEELWETQPKEYICRDLDPYGDLILLKSAAVKLLQDIVFLRTKHSLDLLMNHCDKVLQDYQKNPNSVEALIQKEGALYAINIIEKKLKVKENYIFVLEPLLVNHVMPEFSSPYGFMRARACTLFGTFAEIPWKNEDNLKEGFHKVINCLIDSDATVRIYAAISLKNLVLEIEDVKEQIGENLPELIQTLLVLMNEIGIEEVVSTIHLIVSKFGDEIVQYSGNLCKCLVDSFVLFVTNAETRTQTRSAAMESLRTISTLLEVLVDVPESFTELTHILAGPLYEYFDANELKYLETILDILAYLTYYSPQIEPELFLFIDKIHEAFFRNTSYLLKEMLMSLDNFVSRANDLFLTLENGKYLNLVLQICEEAITSDNVSEQDAVEGCKLIESVIQNSLAKIDNLIPSFLELALRRLETNPKTMFLRVLLFGVIANCLWYNAALVIPVLKKKQIFKSLFEEWMNLISNENLKSIHSKKIAILGLSSVLTVPNNQMEKEVVEMIPRIFNVSVTLYSQMQQQVKEKEMEKENESESESDEMDNQDMDDEYEDDGDGIHEQKGKSRYKNVNGMQFLEESLSSDSDEHHDHDHNHNHNHNDDNDDDDEYNLPDELEDDEDALNDRTVQIVKALMGDLSSAKALLSNEPHSHVQDDDSDGFYDEDENYVSDEVEFVCPIDNVDEGQFLVSHLLLLQSSNQKLASLCLRGLKPKNKKEWQQLKKKYQVK